MGKVIDLLGGFSEICQKEFEKRSDEDYEVNPDQARKLAGAYLFFEDLAKKNNGRVESFKVIPKEIHGGITAYFPFFYLGDEDIARFCEVISDASAVSIDATTDGETCISLTIPRVFQKK